MLVSLGDAVLARYVSPGWLAQAEGSGLRALEVIRSDPIRIIEAIIAGVSFLGAGTIFRGEKADRVEGLTTAASILFSAAVGVATALHQFAIAGGATLLALLALRGLLKLEKEVPAER